MSIGSSPTNTRPSGAHTTAVGWRIWGDSAIRVTFQSGAHTGWRGSGVTSGEGAAASRVACLQWRSVIEAAHASSRQPTRRRVNHVTAIVQGALLLTWA